MGSQDAEWRQRLIAACERTLTDLDARDDADLYPLIANVEALRDRLRHELDADRGPARPTEARAAAPPRQPNAK